MALTQDLRQSCSKTVNKLEDAVNQYFAKSTLISDHKKDLEKLNQEKRDLQQQVSNADQSAGLSLENQLTDLKKQSLFAKP